jgi:predicted metal-binding protein
LLELEVLRSLNKSGQGFLDVREIIWLDVDMMCGIEYEEFPARIAEVAMWLIDHQMNMQISNEFGQYFIRLPLKKAAKIVHGDALETDWESVISKSELSYIIGNPPFIGHHLQNTAQKQSLHKALHEIQGAGVLDYVTAWYVKAAQYIQNTKIKVALVSTNSICQGEQATILWSYLINKYNVKIHFAHRTFKWNNEAKGIAAVHCVIVGFANYDTNNKSIFEYEDIKGEAHEIKAKNINPYLVDAKDILVENRSTPICNVPKMLYGSKPTDGGYFILTEEEKNELLKKEPLAEKFIKKYVNAKPDELKKLPEVMKRVDLVKKFREASVAESTRNFQHHTLFRQVTQPSSDYILIPSTTSERKKYIPFGFLSKDIILSNASFSLENTTLFHFGVLMSSMHMAWVRTVCGRLKSDYRYSKDIVYNNFPWPEIPTEKQTKSIETAAQKVLDARAEFPNSSLSDLYDPLTMPPVLTKAHNELDKAVDLAYRSQPFTSEAKRMEFLFELYEKYTADLFTKEKVKKPKKNFAAK